MLLDTAVVCPRAQTREGKVVCLLLRPDSDSAAGAQTHSTGSSYSPALPL